MRTLPVNRYSSKYFGVRLALALLACALFLTPRAAQAQTATYASSRRAVNAGILVVDPALKPFPGYAFYVLDSRTDIKPGDWNIVNPLAGATVSAAQIARWGTNGGSTDGSLALGRSLTKNMVPYWEVSLDNITDEDIRKFDILLLPLFPGGSLVNLNPAQRERLRRYVDGGGTLWIELEENKSGLRNFFIELRPGTAAGGSTRYTAYHPILRYPFNLSDYDLYQVQPTTTANSLALFDPAFDTPIPYMSGIIGGGSPTIAAGDYGAGHLIFSAAQIAYNINSEITIGGQNLHSAPQYDSSLKILSNMIAWTTSAPTQGGSARRANATGERLGAQLGAKWTWTYEGENITPGKEAVSGAVLYKEMLFAADSNGILRAFDRDPGQNLFKKSYRSLTGAPYNKLLETEVGKGRVSTPTVTSTSGGDRIAVTTDTGVTTVLTFLGTDIPNVNGFKTPGIFRALGGFDGGGGGQIAANIPIPAPIYSEGIFFCVTQAPNLLNGVGGVWRVVPLDQDGNNVFGVKDAIAPYATGMVAALPGIPNLHGPITAGLIRDTTTGALDKVIYCTGDPYITTGNPVSETVIGLWFSAKNDQLTALGATKTDSLTFHAVGARARAPWYLDAKAAHPELLPVVHIIHKSVQPYTYENIGYNSSGGKFKIVFEANEMRVIFSGTDINNKDAIVLPNDEVYVDYTLNWPALDLPNATGGATPMNASNMALVARSFASPTQTSGINPPPFYKVIGGAALSQQDTVIFNALYSNPLEGRVYAQRDPLIGANGGTARRQVAWMFSPSAFSPSSPPSRLRFQDAFSDVSGAAGTRI